MVAGKRSESSATHAAATGSASFTSQPSGARSAQTSSNCSKPGMLLAAIVRIGPAATRLTRMLVRAEVAGEVARGGLERGLGDAHPVVDRPRDAAVVEVEADDRAAAGHQRPARDRERLQRVRGDLHRDGDVFPRRGEEPAAEARLGCEPDRVQHAVEPAADAFRERVEVRLVGDVELDRRPVSSGAGARRAA